MFSANWYSYAALSATSTLATPSTLAAASAAAPQLEPATSTSTSPPIALAAVMVFRVAAPKAALLCSAITKIVIT